MNHYQWLRFGPGIALVIGMEAVMNLNWNKMSLGGFLAGTLISAWTSIPQAPIRAVIELPRLQFHAQKAQARELLNRVPATLSENEENERRLGLYIYHTLQ